METVLSGIRSTGNLHLGNYFGALKNFVRMQHDERCFFFIADYHSLTTHPDPGMLHVNVKSVLCEYLAAGLDPDVATIYVQSDVPEVAELSLLLGMHAFVGELERTASFKEKIRKHPDNVNIGLLSYPVLMAADILLYQADVVPVGNDQKQHLEICRDIATRFNSLYGNVFTIPEGYYPKLGARVMSLQDPKRKMSKSDPDDCFISMLDGPDVVRRKLRRAVTDSESEIRFDAENKPGVSNLLAMLCALTGESMDHAVESFAGKGYGDLKSAVADAIVATLEPIQADYNRYMSDKAYLETVYRQGAERAGRMAERTLSKAMKKIGFIAK